MKLICNGDDFGITKACNYALIDCFTHGIMRSTSMMTNMPGAEHAATLMKQYPDLSVGIHLSLTVGKPLTKGLKTIVKADGNLNKNILKQHETVDLGEIRTEIRAQFDEFLRLTGQLPTHINSHHGIEVIPGAEEFIIELSNEYHLPIRRFFTLKEGNHPNCEFEIAKSAMIFKNDWSEPIYSKDILDYFSEEMLASDDIYEYAAHPGYVDYDLLQLSSLTIGRCYDANNFMCDEIKDWVVSNGIELVDYSALRKL